MAKAHSETAGIKVQASKAGRPVTPRGTGALKGRLQLDPNIDLTKPIAAQVLAREEQRSAKAKR